MFRSLSPNDRANRVPGRPAPARGARRSYALDCIFIESHSDAVLELLVSDEFAGWFAGLDQATAEDVATALEIIERLGPRQPAPGSSEWLLWYEHRLAPEYSLVMSQWAVFRDEVRAMIEHLESPRFATRLRGLGPHDAATVATAMKKIKSFSGAGRRVLATGTSPPAGHGGLLAEIRQWYRAALEAVGLEPVPLPVHSSALRELDLRARAPGVRLLYGVDTERDVAVVVLGEWLDHDFYGDSVRLAERLWRQFLQGHLPARERAALR